MLFFTHKRILEKPIMSLLEKKDHHCAKTKIFHLPLAV